MINRNLGMNPISLSVDAPSSPLFTAADEDLKKHLALDGDALDSLVFNAYVPAAVAWAEDYMHRTIMARSHRWVLRDFPRQWYHMNNGQEIVLPRGKTIAVHDIEYSVGGSIRALYGPTSGGSPSEEVGFQEDLNSDSGGVLLPLRGRCWPSVDCDVPAPVVINFRAGYESPEDVPAVIRHAVMFAIDDMLEVRGITDLAVLQNIAATGSTFDARTALLAPYRLIRIY